MSHRSILCPLLTGGGEQGQYYALPIGGLPLSDVQRLGENDLAVPLTKQNAGIYSVHVIEVTTAQLL